jgi:uncharacterized protein YqjF (DUF2071 family)
MALSAASPDAPRDVVSGAGPRPAAFLTAEWRHLAFVNWEAPAALLTPLAPRGTELDGHRGRTFISLVGFRFLRTRLLGVPVPWHRDFDEVNLRFYVRRTVADEVRRAVVFIREVFPRYAIAALARATYNEPYVTRAMRSPIGPARAGGVATNAEYAWRHGSGWCRLAVDADGEPVLPPEDSDAAFITEHYWGYTRQRDGGTIEYRVEHPQWHVRRASAAMVNGDLRGMYGEAFGDILSSPPASAFFADGSRVTVFRPSRIA